MHLFRKLFLFTLNKFLINTKNYCFIKLYHFIVYFFPNSLDYYEFPLEILWSCITQVISELILGERYFVLVHWDIR